MTENITYNPMSKEFQDECKRLGLTGCQLITKYRKEGRSLKEIQYIRHYNISKEYTEEESLDELRRFEKEEGRVPIEKDLINNPEYPSNSCYRDHFGSLNNALKLVGMDLDTRVMKGCVKTEIEKARHAELKVINHFRQHPIDLAGENHKSPCDGICPNGKTYDVKSSKLYKYSDNDIFYDFHTSNKYKEEIEIYYLLGFNKDWTKLNRGWRIPGEMTESNRFRIGLNIWSRGFTVDSMKQYDITNKLKESTIFRGR